MVKHGYACQNALNSFAAIHSTLFHNVNTLETTQIIADIFQKHWYKYN